MVQPTPENHTNYPPYTGIIKKPGVIKKARSKNRFYLTTPASHEKKLQDKKNSRAKVAEAWDLFNTGKHSEALHLLHNLRGLNDSEGGKPYCSLHLVKSEIQKMKNLWPHDTTYPDSLLSTPKKVVKVPQVNDELLELNKKLSREYEEAVAKSAGEIKVLENQVLFLDKLIAQKEKELEESLAHNITNQLLY